MIMMNNVLEMTDRSKVDVIERKSAVIEKERRRSHNIQFKVHYEMSVKRHERPLSEEVA